MVGTRGPRDMYVCWILVSVGGMNAGRNAAVRGAAERKNSRSRAGPWLCSFVFPAAVHVESCWVFLETRFSRVRRERGEEDVGDVGGLELGLADEVVQTRWFRRMYIRLHLQHGTHQQG